MGRMALFPRTIKRIETFRTLASRGEGKAAILKTIAHLLRMEIRVAGLDYARPVNGWGDRATFYPTAGDAVSAHPKYPGWRDAPALPPPRLMHNVGAPDTENFLVVGEAWAGLIGALLKPGSTILDIGCGCGRTARYLLRNPSIRRYIGFDIVKPSIDWCNNFLASQSEANRFRFVHLDVKSKWYNPDGAVEAGACRFPAEDAAVDLAVAASLFTHLLEPDARHYLEEAARVLKPGGIIVLSLHPAAAGEAGSGGDEFFARIDPVRFEKLAAEFGLALREARGEFCGQLTFIYERR